MSPHRAGLTTLAALGIALTLSGCSSGVTVTGENENVTTIVVTDPRSDSGLSDCSQDDAITDSFQTADMPSSHLSYTLAPSAEPEDVDRILDCLEQALSSGKIELLSSLKSE